MMNHKRFFIKENYVANNVPLTHDSESGGQYWTPKRIYYSRYYQLPVYNYAAKLIHSIKRIKNVIDVGCGVGTKLYILHERFPNVDFVGIDQKSAIDYCKIHHTFASWYIDDFENPEKSSANIKADLVICSDVIEHLMNPDILLDYLKSKVNKDGYIVLSTPERDLLHGSLVVSPKNKDHIREWNYHEFKQYLISRGFYIKKHFLQYPVGFGMNRLFYQECIKRLLSGKPLRYNQVCLLKVNKF